MDGELRRNGIRERMGDMTTTLKSIVLAVVLGLFASLGTSTATTLATTAPAEAASGYVNHSEFNNIYFAEPKSVFENRANVSETNRIDLRTNPDSYIIYYQAIFSDLCVSWVEVHVWRGSDGLLYIRPWKGILKCGGQEVRYDL